MNSDKQTQSSTNPTNDQLPAPLQPAHMFTNAKDVNIGSGNYQNISGAYIRNHGPNIDPLQTKETQAQLKATRERYGANTNVSAFEGFTGRIFNAGTFKNVAGGEFSIVHDERSEKMDLKQYPIPSEVDNFPAAEAKLPPTRYEATMFKEAEVDDLQFENMRNVATVDLSGLDLTPKEAARVYQSIMATNEECASSMVAESFKGVKSKSIKTKNVVNVAGARF
ncbi:hypothetical protein BDQ17DRAFT_1372899 [Cyathus striatus]|nr:hypothetical protein BDQ17DRAFT_1372899 [Cyathus striatus]